MGAICDKGVNEKYLVVNLGRNKKAYISFADINNERVKYPFLESHKIL